MTEEQAIQDARQTILESLESAAYMFADAEDTEPISSSETLNWLGWKIGFHGPSSGNMEIYMPPELGKKTAANMLGIESESISTEILNDAMGEVLNISCGRFLTEHFGDNPVFDISAPIALEKPGYKIRTKENSLHWLSLENFPMAFLVEVTWSVS